MQLSALFLSTITVVVCVNAATIPSHIKAESQDNLLQARSYDSVDSVDSGNEAHLERRSPGYGTPRFINTGFGGGRFGGGFGGFGGGGFRVANRWY
ncbi:hypothetical protein BASA50_000549 [Batrachochytrium salamandrivorans]|uniref:Uncharacterized protein n=1 Tax=Batrachochytrium salamandrivorans TaxID=1357716 RepID=A0ABQ8ETK5_9FUNG|nr:hypothetical protein BASA62_008224 [Batrachochytrium salamandrivorans]KAH6584031.1 hypothetical protein BASA60_001130 [Batrachochytrium salamandrivorans]KAH6586376.1 hypothetical protein BASA50_000549 [Batrachochytrium salamandrivorans]KAH6593179.1 hypothetical protein BASA61_004326 [Batrachochytrium salamandrivorans]KAH9268050.1 hypothetical protein BASA83_009555 [Batrachochytrium salamandrivorans]